jgi:hypothetical protein
LFHDGSAKFDDDEFDSRKKRVELRKSGEIACAQWLRAAL